MAKSDVVSLILHDGGKTILVDCSSTSDGCLRSRDGRVEVPAASVEWLAANLAFLAASQVLLKQEADFHAIRRQMVFKSLFENNGDLLQLVRTVSQIAVAVVAILLFLRVGSLDGAVAHLQGTLDELHKVATR